MKNKILLILLMVLLLTGCDNKINQNDGKDRIYLDDIYYNNGEQIKVDSDHINNLEGTYILFTYNNYCTFKISCDMIFETFMDKYDIDFLSIPFEDFKNTKYYETVKFAPSILIISNGEIIKYLDANSDEDLIRYQDVEAFEKWLDNYVYFTKKTS